MNGRGREICFSIAFLTGIVIGTAIGLWQQQWMENVMSVYRTLFELQFSTMDLPESRQVFYVMKNRGIMVLALLSMELIGIYQRAIVPFLTATGIWFGIAVTGLTICYGMRGIPIFFLWLIPQGLIWGLGMMILYEYDRKKQYFNSLERAWIVIQIMLLFLAGILAECYLQPMLLRNQLF